MRYRARIVLQEIEESTIDLSEIQGVIKESIKFQDQSVRKVTFEFESIDDVEARKEALKLKHILRNLISNGYSITALSYVNLTLNPNRNIIDINQRTA